MPEPADHNILWLAGCSLTISWGLPHACGGVSYGGGDNSTQAWSSPRLWGCFLCPYPEGRDRSVFPTPVGVFLDQSCGAPRSDRLPHACGGVSNAGRHPHSEEKSSPRLWGCFRRPAPLSARPAVFPTPVGVFLSILIIGLIQLSLPHACGGVSPPLSPCGDWLSSSPRLWGGFYQARVRSGRWAVFPTPVGGAAAEATLEAIQKSSPHTWGCFRRRPRGY